MDGSMVGLGCVVLGWVVFGCREIFWVGLVRECVWDSLRWLNP